MSKNYDVIIIGAGIMGSAAACELSRRGRSVLLLDQLVPPHAKGSSHGETRVIREAYFEDPLYVPIVQRAYELWHELEEWRGGKILEQTGGLMIGPEEGVVFRGAKQSAEQHRLPHEILSADQVNLRFPAFDVPEEFLAVHEPRAGMLLAEKCHQAFLDRAAQKRAQFRWGQTINRWNSSKSRVEVRTAKDRFQADQLVIATGAWTGETVRQLHKKLTIERQVLHWFDPGTQRADFLPDTFPVHVWEYEQGKFFYALPDAGSGVKVALHHQGETTTAETVDREVTDREKLEMQQLVSKFLPALDCPPHQSTVCLYTNTSDEHFLIDWHPQHRNVLIMSPCSGHGFKFAPALGEIAADLLLEGKSRFDIPLFGFDRL